MKLLIIFPADLFGVKIGGAESFLKGFITHMPAEIELEFVGVTANPATPLHCWLPARLGQKEFKSYALFCEKHENRKSWVPLALRFTLALALRGLDTSGRVIMFNRIEPALLFCNRSEPKFLIVHNDIEKQLAHKGSEVFWRYMPWLYFMLERHIFSFLDTVYAVSQQSLLFYRKAYPSEQDKFSFLPTMVDTAVFVPSLLSKEALRQDLGLPNRMPHEKWIIFVGRLQEQKAPVRLLHAFAELLKSEANVRLLVVGEGNMQSVMASLADILAISAKIVFIQGRPQQELLRFYQAADVLVLTSNFEGMPMCVLEALACGLPVVTTDVGEVRRVVLKGSSGEVVTSCEPTDIAQALVTVLRQPQVYNRENCVRSVDDYTPLKVLASVYSAIMALSQREARSHKRCCKRS